MIASPQLGFKPGTFWMCQTHYHCAYVLSLCTELMVLCYVFKYVIA
jgi:hypothetical protein